MGQIVDDAMKAAFKAAYKKTGAALPNYGAAAGLARRLGFTWCKDAKLEYVREFLAPCDTKLW